MKRFIEFCIAAVGVLLFSPLIFIICLLLKVRNRRSVFIKKKRLGKNQNLIYLYKFQFNHETIGEYSSKTNPKKKNRFIRLEKQFYAWGLESLPLLLNVLKGDLSLVGPPPEKPEYLKFYTEEEKEVFSIRPGLWWPFKIKDTTGIENSCDWENQYIEDVHPDKIKNERLYVKDTGIGCDFRLLFNVCRNSINKVIHDRFIEDAQSHNYYLPLDLLLIFSSYLLAYLLRFEWQFPQNESLTFFKSIGFVLFTRIITFYAFGIYKNLWKYVGVRDLITIILASTFSEIVIISVLFLIGIVSHSRSIFLIDWLLCISLIGGSRLSLRLLNENKKVESKFRKNVLIIGAGDVGDMVLRMLHCDVQNNHHVVGFVDNDDAIRGKTIHGVKVLGNYEDIPELVTIFRVDELLIAMTELSSEDMKIILKCCKESNVRHRIVPAVNDLLSGSIHVSKFREVEIADLFGRQPVKLTLSAIRASLEGRRVLVTGAGGSIGSELCRHITEFHPKYLILIDKNENYLHEIRCELESQFETLRLHCSLCSITNKEKLRTVFKRYKPEIVFHAAANKHVPLSDENPEEAVWNNIFGTKILAKTADEFGVQHFVMISTDKAVNPTSVMGATKRIAEFYVQALSRMSKTKFVTVRFGNVLNSNGSVIPIFRKQIERGGPITLTHPDMERYFMSISEAVQLILQTVTLGKNGEIFILEMGKSIRIMDMAMDLISQAGFKPFEDIPIKFIGLRPGEKMYEELVGRNEEWTKTSHANIKILTSKNHIELKQLENKLSNLFTIETLTNRKILINNLKEMVPEYKPCVNSVDISKGWKINDNYLICTKPNRIRNKLISSDI